MLPDMVEASVRRYLAGLDRALPGRVTSCYVVGSIALGAFRPGRSDIDLVTVVGGDLGAADLRRLRRVQAGSGVRTTASAVRHRRRLLTGTVNGVFVRADDLARPVTEIVPVACAVGHAFKVGTPTTDVSPVAWKVLAERGIPVRGPSPSALALVPEPEAMVAWNRGNLASYWRPWAQRVRRQPLPFRLEPRSRTAWGVLGAPRLLHSIATGDVISKEAAGEYALDVLDAEWHPLIAEALAYWRGQPPTMPRDPMRRARSTADFIDAVCAAATPTSTPR